jgi:hypothetical protein
MNMQKLFDTMSEVGKTERSKYHATFGDFIDKLKTADETARITPKIVGIGAYRGYYSDIALCTEDGSPAWKTSLDYDSPTNWDKWGKENRIDIDFVENPKKLAEVLESLLGAYFDGYKGGYNEITRETPLWLAKDYGDCSDVAVVEVTDKLELITKTIE